MDVFDERQGGRPRRCRAVEIGPSPSASERQDVVVNGPLAREMFVKERLRDAGGHRQLLSRGAGKSFAREERQGGVHDSGPALDRIMTRFWHPRILVSVYSPSSAFSY